MNKPSFGEFRKRAELLKWINETFAPVGGIPPVIGPTCAFLAQPMMVNRQSRFTDMAVGYAKKQEFLNECCPKVFIPRLPDPTESIMHLGVQYHSREPIAVRDSLLPEGVVIVGTKGAGKTQGLSSFVRQAIQKQKRCTWIDFRADADRFFNIYPPEMIVKFTVETEPRNFACPLPDRCRQTLQWFVSKLGWYDNLPGITRSEATKVLLQLDAGRKLGEPPLSVAQVGAALKIIGERGKQQSLLTFTRSIEGLASVIGKAAHVRSFRMPFDPLLTILSWPGLSPRLCAFQLGFLVYLKQLRYEGAGFSPGSLRELFIIDEALNIASQHHGEVGGGESLSPIRSLATKARPYGIGLIIASQILAELDAAVLSNWAIFICFRLANLRDARIATELLRMPTEAAKEILALPPRVAYVITSDWPTAVKVEFPVIELGDYPDSQFVERCNRPFLQELEKSTLYSDDTPDAIVPIHYESLIAPKPNNNTKEVPRVEESMAISAGVLTMPRSIWPFGNA